MRTSYNGGVEYLLTDVTQSYNKITMKEREELVRLGTPRRSVIIEEYPMSRDYFDIVLKHYEEYNERYSSLVGQLAEMLYEDAGNKLVLVSIVRAGVPIGILIKMYLEKFYGVSVPHYGISLIDGPDKAAMECIIKKHDVEGIRFVDGWSGKGTVALEIKKSVEERYPDIKPDLFVLADPAGVCRYCVTKYDVYIPYSPLNAVSTGLVSVTAKMHSTGFHAATYLSELELQDVSNGLIKMASSLFTEKQFTPPIQKSVLSNKCRAMSVANLLNEEINSLNVGINEVGRALLRRRLMAIYVRDINCPEVSVIKELATLKNIPVVTAPIEYYTAVSVACDGDVR